MRGNLWPEGKTSAFLFCFDMDSDLIWFNKLKTYEHGTEFLMGPSVGRYGPNRGVDRILNLLEKYHIKGTFFVPGVNAMKNPDVVERIVAGGHEVAHHGLYHEPSYGDTVEKQMDIINRAQDMLEQTAGYRAVGFRCTGGLLPGTKRILFHDPDTLYMCQGESSEYPCFETIDGEETDVVRISCRQEVDDYIQMVYNTFPPIPSGLPRIAPYEDVLSNFIDEIKGNARYGGALSTAYHPQVSGSPGKSKILEAQLEYVASHSEIWSTTCRDVALWIREQKKTGR